MGLIECPDCGKQVSTEAPACPSCGRPLKAATAGTFPAAIPQPVAVAIRPQKSRGIYIILGLFFGLLGIHNFYAGYHGKGAVQLIITILLGWIYIGIVITGIWVIVDLVTVKKDAAGNQMT